MSEVVSREEYEALKETLEKVVSEAEAFHKSYELMLEENAKLNARIQSLEAENRELKDANVSLVDKVKGGVSNLTVISIEPTVTGLRNPKTFEVIINDGKSLWRTYGNIQRDAVEYDESAQPLTEVLSKRNIPGSLESEFVVRRGCDLFEVKGMVFHTFASDEDEEAANQPLIPSPPSAYGY